MRNALALFAAVWLISSATTLAHHSLASQFDEEKPLMLAGADPFEGKDLFRTLRLPTERGDALMQSPPCVEKDGTHLMFNDYH
jgi:hypothetical protein